LEKISKFDSQNSTRMNKNINVTRVLFLLIFFSNLLNIYSQTCKFDIDKTDKNTGEILRSVRVLGNNLNSKIMGDKECSITQIGSNYTLGLVFTVAENKTDSISINDSITVEFRHGVTKKISPQKTVTPENVNINGQAYTKYNCSFHLSIEFLRQLNNQSIYAYKMKLGKSNCEVIFTKYAMQKISEAAGCMLALGKKEEK